LISQDRRQYSNWIASPCWGRNWPNRVAAEGPHSCCLVETTTALTTHHELTDLPHLPIATCPVDKRNQILLTSQSPGKTTSELLFVH
jgi:hypothetical protein